MHAKQQQLAAQFFLYCQDGRAIKQAMYTDQLCFKLQSKQARHWR
ncbi:hypothetical protein ACQJBY_020952 [Aegilops geniculata]